LATIDVGTNTILLLIAEVHGPGEWRVLVNEAEITRLGEGVEHHRFLGEAGQRRSLRVLQRYLESCRSHNVEEIIVVGTSALRDAANAIEFKARLKQELSLDLRVLSPEEEARYSYRAVQMGLPLKATDLLVVDVGGGSTEFVWGKEDRLHRWVSLPIGSVRLTERWFSSDVPREEECASLVGAVNRELAEVLTDWKAASSFGAMVGIAGTVTTLAMVKMGSDHYSPMAIHGSYLGREDVQGQIDLFKVKTIAERSEIPGLDPKRADVILAGALLIDSIMGFFRMKRVVVSDQGIRHGLLHDRFWESHEQAKPGDA
jgi:exopolyphosphatase/guanosine-5'-triphosphate,3'-diphosphate pyrophosphatase